jgi:NAD(P)-dependent dehydrogenase (short-subunit alcohol dehydrogenase family)
MDDPKHYLVIGAAGAVGQATVALLRGQGHLVDTTHRAGGTDADDVTDAEGESLILDMSSAEDVRATLDGYFARRKRVDGVAVCSGVADAGPLELASLAAVRHSFEVNTLSVLAVYQSAMPRLRESKGALAIVGSISGLMAIPFLGAYSSSKFALEAMADIMRREAYRWGVHVGIVEPGTIRTPMTVNQIASTRAQLAALSDAQRTLYADMYESFIERVEDRLPASMEPEEVAAAVVAILSDRITRRPVGAGAIESARFARSGDDFAIDEQFRAAFGGSLGPVSGA